MKKTSHAIALLVLIPTLSFAEEVASPTAPPAPAAINCEYKIPEETGSIEQTLITTWAKKALVQSFQFAPEKINNELEALKSCYTEQGWIAFNEALKTSGNLEAIRTNNLNVSSEVDGEIHVENIKDKQWKVSMPLKVTYQNKDKQLLQTLNVNLLIALKKSGSLGIMQVIAAPQKNKNT
ncbi:MAG: hypothetical protein GW760_05100 [Legionella sp.]|nr:hypothetical protein [Legionella sp.]